VEQSDDRGVHKPDLIGPSGSGCQQVDSLDEYTVVPTPVVGTDQSIPFGWPGEDSSKSLSQTRECLCSSR